MLSPKVTLKDLEKDKEKAQDEPYKPKRKYPGFRKNVVDYFTEYSSNTGIHGFKYMGEQDRTWLERLWWLVLFCISLFVCVDLIIKTYIKWDQSPVLVSFAQSSTPVWQIPFPAITICPETKSRQRDFNFTEFYHRVNDEEKTGMLNMTEDEYRKFQDIALVCDQHLFNKGTRFTNYSTIDNLFKLSPHFGELFWSCKWTNENETCANFFSPMLTEDGVCFTFNMLDQEEFFTNEVYLHNAESTQGKKSEGWTIEGGYPREAEMSTKPRRAMSSGASAGLFLLLRAFEQDLDYVCRGPVQGFKILLHHPAEIPRVASQYYRAPLNQEIIISVKPDMMTTSDGLKSYEPERRQCYFQNDRQLRFFQTYTQQNCQVECLTNFTLKECECVGYHMPHEEHTRICGSGSIECLMNASRNLLLEEVDSGISRQDGEEKTGCQCLPSCTSISYNAELSQADFNWQKVFEGFKANFSEFPGVQMTRITIFFKEQQFITSERNELYGQTDFLANCGGLLGLFTGFSFLSIVEIIYFLSLRLMCNIRKYGKHYWSGSEELINDDAYLHK